MSAYENKATKNKELENLGTNGKRDDNIWAQILSDVLESSQSKLPTSKSLLVLGDNDCGKTTLIAKGQGVAEHKKGAALEYFYINVKDQYGEEQTQLGAYIIDGDLHHRQLLKFALTENNFEHTVALLVASLDRPWDIMDGLTRWGEVLTTHVQRLKLDPIYRKERQDAVHRHFQEYHEAGEEGGGGNKKGVPLLPLGDDILTENVGLPVVVVLTKSDTMVELEKNHDYQLEHWDFIQQHIRKFCLKFGASLIYTSVKEDKNCGLLFKYLSHLVYNFPFTEQPCVVEKDSVFIPAGWDNWKKLSLLYEALNTIKHNDRFNDIIRAPLIRNVQKESEVIADEDQLFLMKLQTHLTKQPADTGAQRASPGRTPPATSIMANKVSPSRSNQTSINSPIQNKKPEMRVNSAVSDTGVLANFFNSLLSKKTADGKIATERQNSMEPSLETTPAK